VPREGGESNFVESWETLVRVQNLRIAQNLCAREERGGDSGGIDGGENKGWGLDTQMGSALLQQEKT